MIEQGWDADVLTAALREIIRQDNKITRLRKALTFYADAERYQYMGWQGVPSVIVDTGYRARAALKEDT